MRPYVPVLALAVATVLALPNGAAARVAEPAANEGLETATSSVESSITVVAEGLDTPRGLTWDPWRRQVLVTEAGRGGEAPCAPGVGGFPACFGETGAVTAYDPRRGTSRQIATELPSVINEFSVLGLHDIDVRRGRIHVLFGLGGTLATREGLGAEAEPLGQSAILTRSGRLRPVGDLLSFEQANDPDPVDLNSNPYGLLQVRGGAVVADAGANAVLRVGRHGRVRLLATLPAQTVDGETVEAVPSAVVVSPDGALYVSEYGGSPSRIGAARVWRLVPGQEPTVHATGFTGIIDIAVDRQDRLLVLELAEQGFESDDTTGRLVRIEHDGSRTVLAREGLDHPGGLLVHASGDLYVTNRTTALGDRSGQLLRIELDE